MRRMQGLVAGLLVATSASPSLAKIRDWKIFQMPPAEIQQRQAEIWDPYPMTDIGPLDRTVRPPYWQHPTPEAARQRWPAPGTFPRVRLPADTTVRYGDPGFVAPEQDAAPPEGQLEQVPAPAGAQQPQAQRSPQIQPQSRPQAQPVVKFRRPAQTNRRTQPE